MDLREYKRSNLFYIRLHYAEAAKQLRFLFTQIKLWVVLRVGSRRTKHLLLEEFNRRNELADRLITQIFEEEGRK